MNHNIKFAIEPSELTFKEVKIIKDEDIPDSMKDALKKAMTSTSAKDMN